MSPVESPLYFTTGVVTTSSFYNISCMISNLDLGSDHSFVYLRSLNFRINGVSQEDIASVRTYLDGTIISEPGFFNSTIDYGDSLQTNLIVPITDNSQGATVNIVATTISCGNSFSDNTYNKVFRLPCS
jgi:hypothetical protein